jgi:uncharacterized protein
MRILVTGATGLVGTELVHRLFRQGADIHVVSRNPSKALQHFAVPVKAFLWKAPYDAFPMQALEGVTGIVNLMGENIAAARWTANHKKRVFDSRSVGTEKLAEAVAKSKRELDCYVQASAVGFYGDRQEEVLTETAAAGSGFLSEVCKAWEAAAAKVPAKRSVILRIGVVMARQGGFLPRLLPIFRKGLGGPVGNGNQWVSWIHLEDLCHLFLTAVNQDSAKGIWNACSAQAVTNRELGRTLATVLDKPFGLPAPRFALKTLLGEMADLALDSTRAVGAPSQVKSFQFPDLDGALRDLLSAEMQGYQVYEADQWVQRPIESVFEFFSAAENLERITPPWLNFHVVGKSTTSIQNGTLIDYNLKIKGVPVRWQSRIEQWEPPHKFVDTQIRGPYKYWHHLHTFETVRNGTWLHDRVHYRVPMGGLGQAVLGWQIRKDVETIFSFRTKTIREMFA